MTESAKLRIFLITFANIFECKKFYDYVGLYTLWSSTFVFKGNTCTVAGSLADIVVSHHIPGISPTAVVTEIAPKDN